MVFPDRLLRAAREAAGLTQTQLADRLGMTQSGVAKLERPGANPSVETLDRALRAAGTRLVISASPWAHGVDDTLIAAALRETPQVRVASAVRLYERARALAGAAGGRDDHRT